MSYICIGKFRTPIAARDILTYAREIAEVYDHVSMTDMNDLIGNQSEYSDCKYGWTLSKLRLAYVEVLAPDVYSIHMPACDWFYDEAVSFTAKPKEKTESEPINITVPADKPDGIKQAINTLFDNLERIKDHQIFINII